MPVALVTGASSGIGRAFAVEFAAHGYDLVLTARREALLEALAVELRERYGVTATVLPADLTQPEAPGRLVAAIEARGIAVDALVNNAGFTLPGAFTSHTWEEQQSMLQAMLVAPTELAHRLLPGMIARRRGYILNVGSVAGMVPGAQGVYASVKSYLLQLSLYLHQEQAPNGIHVTAVCPGFTDTELIKKRPSIPRWGLFWSTPEVVAAEGYGALMRNDLVYVTGWLYKAMTFAARFTPYRVLAFFERPLYGRIYREERAR